MSLSDVSNAAGAARFVMNPTPLGAAGLFGSAMLGGKSGGGHTPVPGGKPGNYTMDNIPVDMTNLSIDGDNGTYNLLSMLGQQKNPYDIQNALSNDKTALAEYNKRFMQPEVNPLSTALSKMTPRNRGMNPPEMSGMNNKARWGMLAKPQTLTPNVFMWTPKNPNKPWTGQLGDLVKYGPQNQAAKPLAMYANDQKHPFFTPK